MALVIETEKWQSKYSERVIIVALFAIEAFEDIENKIYLFKYEDTDSDEWLYLDEETFLEMFRKI